MPRNFKLAILRARHDVSVAAPLDEACRRFLINAPDKSAVLQYWTEATMGNLDFSDVAMFPWVDIEIDAAKEEQIKRGHLARAAVAATQKAGHDLAGYNGLLVLITPGVATATTTRPDGTKVSTVVGFDAGASELDGRPFAVIHTRTSHTFDCHELGHVVGYDHSFGLLNNGIDWAGTGAASEEYGSPYDIMSAMAFGSKRTGTPTWTATPTFARTDLATEVPGWTGLESWQSMGPLPSRAFVFLKDPESMDAALQVRRATLDESSTSASTVLWSAGKLEKMRTSLLVVEDRRSGASRRYCIEYRRREGWDRGLKTSGPDLARQGVVVHSIEAKDGKSYPHFRGAVPIPLGIDSDVALADTDLVLRVVSVAKDLSSVGVRVTVAGARECRIVLESVPTEEKVVSTEKRHVRVPHCGVQQFDWRTAHTRVWMGARAQALGFGGTGAPATGPLLVRWDVGGVKLEKLSSGKISVKANEGHSVFLNYSVHEQAGELTLRSDFESTPFTVPVKASVRESDGSHEVWSSPYLLHNEGRVEGFDASFWTAVFKCLPVEIRRFEIEFPGCRLPEFFRPEVNEVLVTKQPSRPGVGPDPDRVDFELRPVAGLETVLQQMIRPAQRLHLAGRAEAASRVIEEPPSDGLRSQFFGLIRSVLVATGGVLRRVFGGRA